MADTPAVPPPTPTPQLDSQTIGRLAVRNSIWVSLVSYLTQALGFVSNLVLIRLLTPEIYGFFSMATFWMSAFNLRSKAGLQSAAIQRPESNGELLGTYFVLDLLAALGSLLLCGFAAVVMLQIGYARPVVLAILVGASADLIGVVVNPLGMLLEKELQMSRVTLMNLFAYLIAYLTAIILAASGWGIWSLLAILLVQAVISVGGIYWICRRRLPHVLQWRWRFDKALAGHLLKQGLTAGLSWTALGSIVQQYDNFLVGTFVGYTMLGYYDRAYRLASWTNLLLALVLVRVGFPIFAKVQNDRPRLAHATRLSIWIAFALGCPIALVLLFGADDLVHLLYGPDWRQSALFLPYLTLYSLVWPFISIVLWLSIALGHRRVTLLFTAAQVAALVVLATPLTWWWGVRGTIAGVMLTMTLAFLIGCWYIFRTLPISIRDTFGLPVAAALVASLALVGTTRLPVWTTLSPLARLGLVSLMGGGLYALTLFLLDPAELVGRIRYIVRMFRPSQSAAA